MKICLFHHSAAYGAQILLATEGRGRTQGKIKTEMQKS